MRTEILTLILSFALLTGCTPKEIVSEPTEPEQAFITAVLNDYYQNSDLEIQGSISDSVMESETFRTKEEGRYSNGILHLTKIENSYDDYFEDPQKERITNLQVYGIKDLAFRLINGSLSRHYACYYDPLKVGNPYVYEDIDKEYGRITSSTKTLEKETLFDHEAYVYRWKCYTFEAEKSSGRIRSGTIRSVKVISFSNIDPVIDSLYVEGIDGFSRIAYEYNRDLGDFKYGILTVPNGIRTMMEFEARLSERNH